MFSRLLAPLRATEPLARSPAPSPNSDSKGRRRDLLAVALLLLCVWGLHGHGLALGFWFDDHNHLELCRKNGFGDLAGGNRFDWTGRLTHVWWAAQETGWAYYRPLTVAMRTAQLEAFGLNPLPFHLVHLTFLNLSVVLFYGLLRRCGWGSFPSWFAGPSSSCTRPTPLRSPGSPTTAPSWAGCGCWRGCGRCTPRRDAAIAAPSS